jgi:phosphoribosylformylglycinamidine synthase
MSLGILKREHLVLARASGAGNIAVLLGATTGRDGIGGASILASASFDEAAGAKRPTVQVGDPFEEKKLIEACLDLYERGLVVGIQDLGAAGISCATSECASNGGMGMAVDLDAVPLREADMTPGEILMSESQERMLAIVAEDDVAEVLAVAEKWEIGAAVIGTVTEDPALKVHHRGELVAELPAASLADEAPLYHRQIERPEWIDRLHTADAPLPADIDLGDTLLMLLDDPALADRSWIYEQYDHQLFLNTVLGPGGDGSLLRVKGTDKGLAISTDGDGRLCYLDPRRGAERLVFEAALNVAVVGARPHAVVDNLNFGNPEKPEVMWQFTEAVDGMAAACEALGIPVIGGNVSFYNETDGVDIYPTPVVGMLGFCDPIPANPPRLDAAEPDMEIWEVGVAAELDFAGSAFSRVALDHLGGRPVDADLTLGPAVVALAVALAHRGVAVLHDVSSGGTAVTITEIAIRSGVGARLVDLDWRRWLTESPHRFVAVVPTGFDLEAGDVPTSRIGVIGGQSIDFGRHGATSLATATATWRDAIPRRMD